MNVVGRKVSHIKYGKGIIVEKSEATIKIEFVGETKTFKYPTCFEKFVSFIDGDLPDDVSGELKQYKADEEKAKTKAEHIKRVQALLKARDEDLIKASSKKTSRKSAGRTILDMTDVNRECWEYLIKHQQNNYGFYFVPRKVSNKEQLNDGIYFIGDKKNMLVTFWEGDIDSLNLTHLIDFGISDNGLAYIQLSSRDNATRASYLKDLVELLRERTGHIFTEKKKNCWQWSYPKDFPYINALGSFIKNEKIIIDQYINEHPELSIVCADETVNEKYVQLISEFLKDAEDQD